MRCSVIWNKKNNKEPNSFRYYTKKASKELPGAIHGWVNNNQQIINMV